MDTRSVIAARIIQLCQERNITPIKSMLTGESQQPGTITIKKLCDGFEITLGEFFSTPEFDELEQEIK